MHNGKFKEIQVNSLDSKEEAFIESKKILRYAGVSGPVEDDDLAPKWYVDQNGGGGSSEGIVITEASPYFNSADGGSIVIDDFLTAYPEIAASGITRLHIDVLIGGVWYASDVLPSELVKDINGHITSATWYLQQSGTITKLIARSTGGGSDATGETGGGGGDPTNLSLGTITGTTIPILSSTGTDVNLPVATGTLAGLESAADKTKLDGIATGATANDTDANLKNRANHTGVQAATTITEDATHRFITDTERTKLTGIATGATANDTDANLKNRANHTGTQAATTIVEDSTHRFATDAEKAAWNAAVGGGVALGETSTTAYRGDRGKTAYDHSQVTGNPHGTTKSDVGLSNVDNTADSAKPVSTAQQTALDAKAPLASPTFTGTVGGITKSMVGLANVDNTADTAKPVSTAQSTAINAKVADNLTASTTVAPSKTAVNNALALKANIAPTLGTSTALAFAAPNIQGSVGTPLTGNITGVTTGAVVGVVVQVVHNHTSAPTFDSKFKKLSGSGNYVTGVINHIFCEYMSATEIIYSIQQRT